MIYYDPYGALQLMLDEGKITFTEFIKLMNDLNAENRAEEYARLQKEFREIEAKKNGGKGLLAFVPFKKS